VKLYIALKQLQLFRQHKLWKAFKCWKSAIDSTKLAAAKAALNKQLFLLSPVFQSPLQQFHALCHELSNMRLHSIQQGKVSRLPSAFGSSSCAVPWMHVVLATYTGSRSPVRRLFGMSASSASSTCPCCLQVYSLAQFAEQHAQQVQHCAQRLAEFSETAFDIVQAACRDDLVALQQHLETFSVRADSNAPAAAASSHPTLPLSPGAAGQGSKVISVTELLKNYSSGRQQKASTTPTGSSGKTGDAKSSQQVRRITGLWQVACSLMHVLLWSVSHCADAHGIGDIT
jgi:hypothetical protein